MRLFLLGLLAMGSGVASAATDAENPANNNVRNRDGVAAVTRFAHLPFDPNSVKVANFARVGANQIFVTITFKILPTDSCMENYAGLLEGKKGAADFEVVYSHTNQGCQPQKNPRIVPARFFINLGPGGAPLKINGASYGFMPNQDWTELQVRKISSGGSGGGEEK